MFYFTVIVQNAFYRIIIHDNNEIKYKKKLRTLYERNSILK